MSKIVSQITNGIKISVQPKYDYVNSKPDFNQYIHAYHVTIENLTENKVQLLTRHWLIYDGKGSIREVKGDGVIGEQPILSSFESHAYTSWCPLKTPMGKMKGTYGMVDHDTGSQFMAIVPEFRLIADFVNN